MKSKFPEKKVMTRYFVVAAVLTLLGMAVAGKTAYIMFVQRDFWKEVNVRYEKGNVQTRPNRGNIYSSDGELLASSLPEFKIYMDYVVVEHDSLRREKEQHRRDSLFMAKLDSMSEGLHKIFPDRSAAEFRKRLLEGRDSYRNRNWPIYDQRISYIQYKAVKRLPYFNMPKYRSGFHEDAIEQRANPFGSLASRTIGRMYAGKDSARFGLELAYDTILRGKPGMKHRQKVLNKYLDIVDRPQEDGYDIISTIDVGMQDLAEKALVDKLKEISAAEGVAVLMEVKTGDVKAIVNMTRCQDGEYRELKNYAVSNLLEPGSVFKTASFMVAFDDGYLHTGDLVNTGNGKVLMHGRYMKDSNWRNMGNGTITAAECIQKSSNVGVSMLIDKYYFNQPEKFVNGLYRVGIAADLHLPIPGYAKPNIRHPAKDGSNWSKTALAWMSIGYETQVPPISTLAFYNGIANGGQMMAPRFVKAKMRGTDVVEEYPTQVVRSHMCSPAALADVKYCLDLVVKKGTGRKAASKHFPIAGKTGTAQIWTSKGRTPAYLVSFVGYFPSNDPKYSCIVCIKKNPPASGGGQCGPVFKKIAEGVMARERHVEISAARDTLHHMMPSVANGDMAAARQVLSELHVPYSTDHLGRAEWGRAKLDSSGVTLTSETVKKGIVPDVKGMGLRDALFLLESSGMRVSVRGRGRVSEQSISAGTHFARGARINIVLGNSDEKPAQPAEAAPAATADTTHAAQKATAAAEPAEKKTASTAKHDSSATVKKPQTSKPKSDASGDKKKPDDKKKKSNSAATTTDKTASGKKEKSKTK